MKCQHFIEGIEMGTWDYTRWSSAHVTVPARLLEALGCSCCWSCWWRWESWRRCTQSGWNSPGGRRKSGWSCSRPAADWRSTLARWASPTRPRCSGCFRIRREATRRRGSFPGGSENETRLDLSKSNSQLPTSSETTLFLLSRQLTFRVTKLVSNVWFQYHHTPPTGREVRRHGVELLAEVLVCFGKTFGCFRFGTSLVPVRLSRVLNLRHIKW